MPKHAALLATLGLLALPATGWAAQFNPLPHGSSGADEYTENVPGGGGNHPSDEVGGGGEASPTTGAVPPATVQALETQGAAGAAAAGFAQASGPGTEGRSDAAKGAGGGASGSIAGAGSADGDGGGSALGDVVKQITQGSDSGGMGIALPLILAATLLIAFLLALGRRRGRGQTPA